MSIRRVHMYMQKLQLFSLWDRVPKDQYRRLSLFFLYTCVHRYNVYAIIATVVSHFTYLHAQHIAYNHYTHIICSINVCT